MLTPARNRLPQRIHDRFVDICADLSRPLPNTNMYIPPDDPTPTAASLQLHVQMVTSRRLRPSLVQRMLHLFVLGRALYHLESRQAQRWLRSWMTRSRAYRLYRTALRCFELFSVRGVEYLAVVSVITPNVLGSMYLEDYESLLVYATFLGTAHLQEQVSSEEDNVTSNSV